GADFTLTLTGTGFVSGGQVFFDDTALATTVIGATSAEATVPASLIANAHSASVRLVNPPPGGGASGTLSFTITGAPTGVTCIAKYGRPACAVDTVVETNVPFQIATSPPTPFEGFITTDSPGLKWLALGASPVWGSTDGNHTYWSEYFGTI